MSQVASKLTCEECGRSFPWKPEYAGKSLKCKCGKVIKAPAAAPSGSPRAGGAAPAPRKPAAAPKPARDPDAPPSLDDLDDMVAHAEYELAHTEQPTTARAVAMPAMAAAAPVGAAIAGPTSPLLAYAGSMRRTATPQQQKDAKAAQVNNFILPLSLIVAGVLAMFYVAYLMGIHSPFMMLVFVIAKCSINLFLVFTALLVGVKLIDLGLGEIGPALLKIAAAALLPAAVADIIRYFAPWGYVPWVLSIGLYGGMLKLLFDMDLQEIFMVTGIIWVVQTWIAMLIIGLIFTGNGGAATGAGVMALSHPVGQTPDDTLLPPDDVENKPKKFDAYAEQAIETQQAIDAFEWLSPKHKGHIGGPNCTRAELMTSMSKMAQAGAMRVYASQFKMTDKGEICTEFIIALPDRPGDRKPIFAFTDKCVRSIHPSTDLTQRYIQVLPN